MIARHCLGVRRSDAKYKLREATHEVVRNIARNMELTFYENDGNLRILLPARYRDEFIKQVNDIPARLDFICSSLHEVQKVEEDGHETELARFDAASDVAGFSLSEDGCSPMSLRDLFGGGCTSRGALLLTGDCFYLLDVESAMEIAYNDTMEVTRILQGVRVVTLSNREECGLNVLKYQRGDLVEETYPFDYDEFPSDEVGFWTVWDNYVTLPEHFPPVQNPSNLCPKIEPSRF